MPLDHARLHARRKDARTQDASKLDARALNARRLDVRTLDASRLDARRLDASHMAHFHWMQGRWPRQNWLHNWSTFGDESRVIWLESLLLQTSAVLLRMLLQDGMQEHATRLDVSTCEHWAPTCV